MSDYCGECEHFPEGKKYFGCRIIVEETQDWHTVYPASPACRKFSEKKGTCGECINPYWPRAAALRAVIENPDLVLIVRPKDCTNCKHYDCGYKGPCEIKSSPNFESEMNGGIGDYCELWEAR